MQALYFDIRKGAHSVGASVRDAASYVLWSLARAQRVAALAPFAEDLARTLVTVAVFDREVHIRRAASAAFQEFVGRTVRLVFFCLVSLSYRLSPDGCVVITEPVPARHRRSAQDGLLRGGNAPPRVLGRGSRGRRVRTPDFAPRDRPHTGVTAGMKSTDRG